MKNVVTIALLFFVAVSVAYLVLGEMRSGARPADATTKAANNTPSLAGQPPGTPALSEADKRAPLLQAYYFHVTSRCTTCLTIERYAKEAIEEAFASQIEDGRIRWQAVNYDEPAHEHFVKEYGLVSSSLVLVADPVRPTASWRKLERTWDLVGDEKAFKTYVTGEVNALLEGRP